MIAFTYKWGNSYVAVPPSHILNKIPTKVLRALKTTQKINCVVLAKNGYSRPEHVPDNYLIIGFDTMAKWDSPISPDKKWVEEQLELFKQELTELSESDELYKLVAIHN